MCKLQTSACLLYIYILFYRLKIIRYLVCIISKRYTFYKNYMNVTLSDKSSFKKMKTNSKDTKCVSLLLMYGINIQK